MCIYILTFTTFSMLQPIAILTGNFHGLQCLAGVLKSLFEGAVPLTSET